jgi:hypothetical protein
MLLHQAQNEVERISSSQKSLSTAVLPDYWYADGTVTWQIHRYNTHTHTSFFCVNVLQMTFWEFLHCKTEYGGDE